jgi:RNA polymerase sigma-70 factor, ECF subfamily
LARLAALGQTDAIDELLRRLRPEIVRYCRARLARLGCRGGPGPNEDDVAQEVCLALLAALPSYTEMGRPFGAFVFGIAAHKVADVARAAARSGLSVVAGDVPDDVPDVAAGPEESVLSSLDAARARRLLALLPSGQRRLLLLRVVTGLSAAETGYVLDMTPGAVRVAQHRALARLRELAAAS